MTGAIHRDYDVAVVGGGLVGAAIAYGLGRLGDRVVILDEGDMAVRASRGNFALVWVQSKGNGMPEYAVWTVGSSDAWGGFAAELKEATDLDVCFERTGGFVLSLSDDELAQRAALLKRFHNQAGVAQYKTEMLDHEQVAKFLPDIGPDVVGGSYCPLDGHVNSLRLFRSLHTALNRQGAKYLPGRKVTAIHRSGGGYTIEASGVEVGAAKVVLAAGNANQELGRMVGLNVPMRPERGQVLVTERVRPFLRHPTVSLRQTDEGTVMIGSSKEAGRDPLGMTMDLNTVMASRAVRMFPLLGNVNIVRSWRAVRVMPADGFPIYDESPTHPGAFVVTCHSGVTLAAGHALRLAPMIHNGKLEADNVGAFSSRRFDVSQVA